MRKPRELAIAVAAKSLGDVPADRIGRIVKLRAKLQVSPKSWSLRDREDFAPKFVTELPDDQLREVTCAGHVVALSTISARAWSTT
jgi:hypothetical protein